MSSLRGELPLQSYQRSSRTQARLLFKIFNPLRGVVAFVLRRGKRSRDDGARRATPPHHATQHDEPRPTDGSSPNPVDITVHIEEPEPADLPDPTPTDQSAVVVAAVDVSLELDVGPYDIIDVGTLEATSQVIFSAFKEVQNLHPYLKIILLPVKVAIDMEITRRENDARIVFLKGLMLNVAGDLRDLFRISDGKEELASDVIVEARLSALFYKMADDIKDCNKVCEAYMGKRFLVRLFAGHVWNDRLSHFMELFHVRRKQLNSIIGVRNALALHDIEEMVRKLDSGVSVLLNEVVSRQNLAKLRYPRERELEELIKRLGGGKQCLDNAELFEIVRVKVDEGADRPSERDSSSESNKQLVKTIKDLLNLDIDVALRRQSAAFDGYVPLLLLGIIVPCK